jgi:hypothetical protein
MFSPARLIPLSFIGFGQFKCCAYASSLLWTFREQNQNKNKTNEFETIVSQISVLEFLPYRTHGSEAETKQAKL